MTNEPFGDALKFKKLICLLKEAGHTDAPSFAEALKGAETDEGLRTWLEQQQDRRKTEDLLHLHWQEL